MKHLVLAAIALALALLAPSLARADDVAQVVQEHIRALEEGTGHEQLDALHALRKLGPAAAEAATAVLAAMEQASEPVRVIAATVLHPIGVTPDQAIPALASLYDDSDELNRRTALFQLAEYRDAPEHTTPLLVKALDDESESVQDDAIIGFHKVKVNAELAAPALLTCVESWRGDRRLSATRALWRLDFIPTRLLPRLVRLLKDKDPTIRERTLELLERIESEWEEAVIPVAARLSDTSPQVRLAAADRLARWDRREADALSVALLLATAPEGDPELRAKAILVLGRLPGDPVGKRLKVIVEALRDEATSVRSAAVLSLRWVEELPKVAIPLLGEELISPDEKARLGAAWALGVHGIHIDVVVPVLVDLLGSDDWSVPSNAATALGEIGPAARAAIPALEKLQTAESEFLREVVTKALKAIRADQE